MTQKQEQQKPTQFTIRNWSDFDGDEKLEWRGQVEHINTGDEISYINPVARTTEKSGLREKADW